MAVQLLYLVRDMKLSILLFEATKYHETLHEEEVTPFWYSSSPCHRKHLQGKRAFMGVGNSTCAIQFSFLKLSTVAEVKIKFSMRLIN
jgi:hypothetical protein